jgi:hypothetical protein
MHPSRRLVRPVLCRKHCWLQIDPAAEFKGIAAQLNQMRWLFRKSGRAHSLVHPPAVHAATDKRTIRQSAASHTNNANRVSVHECSCPAAVHTQLCLHAPQPQQEAAHRRQLSSAAPGHSALGSPTPPRARGDPQRTIEPLAPRQLQKGGLPRARDNARRAELQHLLQRPRAAHEMLAVEPRARLRRGARERRKRRDFLRRPLRRPRIVALAAHIVHLHPRRPCGHLTKVSFT